VSAESTLLELQAENDALRALVNRLIAVSERLADEVDARGIELPEPAEDQRGCRVVPPPRRCRPGGRRRW
jgi:hypothetical protein